MDCGDVFHRITAGCFIGFLLGGLIGYVGSELTIAPPIVGNPAGGSAPSHEIKSYICIVIGIVAAILGGPIGAVIGGFGAVIAAG
jgi:hypothetical protein